MDIEGSNEEGPPTVMISGGQTGIPEESERELAFLLNLKAKWGFAASRDEVREIVQEYVTANKEKDTPEGEHLRKFCRFKVCFHNYI